jgi:hypothetical protein
MQAPHGLRGARDCIEEIAMAQQDRDGFVGRKGAPLREQPGSLERETTGSDEEEEPTGAGDEPPRHGNAGSGDNASVAHETARETAGGRAGHGQP